ncbi:hypothetical protein HD554DRAFT_2128083 [Boletus coccyginus]|nr:hypothetical protein HD554DRAFT_2128083 [Boletus coccyginus]
MSRHHRRREDPAPSHWEPGYSRSYSDEYSWRHYAPPTEPLPRNSLDYWRGEAVVPTSYYPQRSHRRESYSEEWRDNSRLWPAESSYSGRRRDFGPSRDRDDRRESWGDRSLSQRNPSRQRYSTYTPPPYIPRPTFRATSPMESAPSLPKPTLPDPPPPKASSPPNKSSQPLNPSPGYLSLSQEPSEVLREPAMRLCKLLVLDLNGTLLIRSPRSHASSGPRLRSVQPRPYMQSFRQYLFCPETKAWLDTMVWSSAQPHSVDDMVDKVFGATKGELKAVWNRKSLGLSQADYHQKTVTTKDLAKPWNLFASALGPEKLGERSAVPSQSQNTHSAFTTLLLDDSPHKAVLQPYNHICIPEYGSTRRRHDLQTFLATKKPKEDGKAKRMNQVSGAHSTDRTVLELCPRSALSELAEQESYDATLLAVIGILETVKLQSNVAGWIRKGSLWATEERLEGGASDVDVSKANDGKAASNKVVQTGNDTSSTSDPTLTPEQAHLQTKMWFDDSSVLACWVARGRRALMELGIPAAHGVTG